MQTTKPNNPKKKQNENTLNIAIESKPNKHQTLFAFEKQQMPVQCPMLAG